MKNIANVIAFQLTWFASVIGAANGQPIAGLVVLGVWMVAHFAAFRGEARADSVVVLAAIAFGAVGDSLLVLTGMIRFPEIARLGSPTTLWMIGLWVGFALSLRHALGWLRGRPLLGAALGAVAGPLAYVGGEALGGIVVNGAPGIVAVGAMYAVATPALAAIARWADVRRLGLPGEAKA